MSNKEQILKEIIEDASTRLLAGILHKNVLRHIISLGFPIDIAEKVLKLAESRANEFSHYKIGKYSKEYNHSK
tara:strand:+ start:1027 stop:1245 length:219 start_codon:yes stop_codon:yes gene_type:complete